ADVAVGRSDLRARCAAVRAGARTPPRAARGGEGDLVRGRHRGGRVRVGPPAPPPPRRRALGLLARPAPPRRPDARGLPPAVGALRPRPGAPARPARAVRVATRVTPPGDTLPAGAAERRPWNEGRRTTFHDLETET